MATLFLTERPKRCSDAVRDVALNALLPEVIKWLEQGGEESPDEEDVLKDLRRAVGWNGDGYELARALDSEGWSPDSELVDILNNWAHHEWKAHDDAQKAWVAENANQIAPQFRKGDRVSAKWGHETVTGVVEDIKADMAQYTVRRAKDGPGCGAIVNFEDTEAATC